MEGWIKISRQMLKWGWYDDPITKSVFLDILLHANYEETEYHGHTIKVGQCVYGRKKAAKRLGISERNVRTALEHLKQTGEITVKSTNRFSLVTVEKWRFYQELSTGADQQVTSNRPATDQQLTTSKKERNKEYKEIKKINPPLTPPLGATPIRSVESLLTEEEMNKLFDMFDDCELIDLFRQVNENLNGDATGIKSAFRYVLAAADRAGTRRK